MPNSVVYAHTTWVLSERLHCLFCGHEGLWLGDQVYEAGLEHYCTSCDATFAVTGSIDASLSVERAQTRRALLLQAEKEALG